MNVIVNLWTALINYSKSPGAVTITVFLIFFIDNVLLSMIVPIIPDYLEDKVELMEGNLTRGSIKTLESKIGALFASKSLVQLLMNPVVGKLTNKVEPNVMIFLGSVVFFVSSIVFGAGTSYWSLFAARSVHGIGSALSIVSGLAVLAKSHQEDESRSRAMGLALGGMAVGVLVGYPLGGFLYDRYDKQVPFYLVATMCFLVGVLQVIFLRNPGVDKQPAVKGYEVIGSHQNEQDISTISLLRDIEITCGVASIGLSTLSIATLEPCLPVWLRETINPEEWQIGTAFVPDSFGYLLGTNVFGVAALKLGRWNCAIASHFMITLCCFTVPFATQMSHLIIPHFGIGLGIAVIDASIMPLLACLVELKSKSGYGIIYALSQTTVCLAYGLGPLAGGWLMGLIGFDWLMRCISVLNLGMTIMLVTLRLLCIIEHRKQCSTTGDNQKLTEKFSDL